MSPVRSAPAAMPALCKWIDIGAPLTKRRKFDTHNVQPVVQVLSEDHFVDGHFQVSIVGREYSKVSLNCFRAANSFKRAFQQP